MSVLSPFQGKIRQFRPDEAQACCKLIHACIDRDSEIPPALREKLRSAESPLNMQERAKLFYLVVDESEEGIVGLAGLDMSEVRLLYVSPECRGRGIGRALLEHLEAMVPAALFTDMFVYSTYAAVGFYRAYGFMEKGEFSFDFDGESLRTVFMTLRVSGTGERC